jgi:outer membrane receptor protein involved in Fe transport
MVVRLTMVGTVVAAGRPAQAQRGCAERSTPAPITIAWPAPLDTRVSVRAHDITLRDALDRVSALSGVQLAYASDLLPLDRQTCLDASDEAVGSVLASLLAGTSMEPTVVAGRVVLAPVAGTAPQAVEMARAVGTLERVVVTGSAIASRRRPLAIGVEVIDGDRIRRESRMTLAAILNAAAPGLWVWERSPSSLIAEYAGIRGASSFNSSYPKIYIDGVEVANPLLVSQFDPDVIDRVEVIRGPQGSALYGSDAISGVINVVTRHEGSDAGNVGVRVSSTAGAAATAFGAGGGPVATHDQRIAIRGGSNLRSGGLALEFGQTGAVIPSSESRQLLASGDARIVGSSATITATGRFVDKRAGAGDNPLLTMVPAASAQPQSVRQYTLGTSAIFATEGRWTQSALVGVDGYHLDHVADIAGPYTLGVDSALRAAQGSGDRATLRATTVGDFGGDDADVSSRVTFGIEHAVLRQIRLVSSSGPIVSGARYPTAVQELATSWNHNTGAFSQVSTSWSNSVYLTGGLRVEHNDAFTGANRFPLLPMLGIAIVRDLGDFQVKLRSAYGKGIRPPQTPARTSLMQERERDASAPGLDPELQSGIESGVELYLGSALSLQVTRFDQIASNLIQNVAIAIDTFMHAGRPEQWMRFELQNVGEISNRGWEMQATARRGPLALTSALTIVDSRVRQVADGYLGDLRAGDRMLAVPAQTGSLTASWTGSRWFATVSATRAWSWIDYDRLTLARAYTGTDGLPARDLIGANLRSYWMEYTGQTHLRLATSFDVRHGLELTLTGENLLGGQLGEPDNVTIRPGRTITGGVRASF